MDSIVTQSGVRFILYASIYLADWIVDGEEPGSRRTSIKDK